MEFLSEIYQKASSIFPFPYMVDIIPTQSLGSCRPGSSNAKWPKLRFPIYYVLPSTTLLTHNQDQTIDGHWFKGKGERQTDRASYKDEANDKPNQLKVRGRDR